MDTDKQLKILLVEDSASDAALIQESIALSDTDISVSVATSLHEAIEHCKNNHFDTALLDLTLPDSSGLDTVRRARQSCPDTPIVVMTGVDDEQIGVEAVRIGVQDYLVKGQADGKMIVRAIRYAIERKNAELQIRLANERLQYLLIETSAVIYTSKVSGDYANTFISENVARLTGFNAKEFTENPNFWLEHIHPDDKKRVLNALPRTFKEPYLVLEYRLLRSSSSYVWIRDEMRVVRDNFGKPLEIIGCLVDITSRKHMEEELQKAHDELEGRVKERTMELADALVTLQDQMEEVTRMQKALLESELKYRELVENANSIIMRRDATGKILFFNEFAQKFLGFSEKEIIGRNIIGTIVPQIDSSGRDMKARVADISKNPELYQNFEAENMCKDGRRVWINWTIKPIKDENDKVVEILSVGNDITYRKQAEMKLQEYEAKLRSLTTELLLTEERERRTVAEALHDSIGPLLAFSQRELGSLQNFVTKEVSLSLDEVKHHINDAVKQTRSLTFDLSPSSLYDLGFEAAVEELTEQFAEERKLKFSFKDSEEPKPLSDETKILLYRSVRELLVNIAKHAEAKTVWVSLSNNNSNIEITIKDNGKGFDTTKPPKSRGFGLFSIRERLTHIGGQFSVESQKGKGTKITLLAPLNLTKK